MLLRKTVVLILMRDYLIKFWGVTAHTLTKTAVCDIMRLLSVIKKNSVEVVHI